MREWYIDKGDYEYECPYCHTEVMDCTGYEVETHETYCGKCGREYRVVVLDDNVDYEKEENEIDSILDDMLKKFGVEVRFLSRPLTVEDTKNLYEYVKNSNIRNRRIP